LQINPNNAINHRVPQRKTLIIKEERFIFIAFLCALFCAKKDSYYISDLAYENTENTLEIKEIKI
jgi:hypothetical protein